MEDEKRIGYFSLLKSDAKFVGGIMVTNQFGVPIEFKYTEPIVPTKMQKILFGKVLDKYIRETIVRDQLARAVHLKPLIYILGHEDRSNLGAIEGWDTIAVQKVQINQADMVGRFARTKDREVIVQLEDTDFLRLTFSTLDESVQQKIINLVIELSRGMDIVEPLERVENALRNLCQDSQESNLVKH
jgi:hypothetical protein